MKSIAFLCVLVAMVVARPGETYDSRYDSFDVQTLTDNPRILKSYGNCFISKGPCTAEGNEFKKVIPEALRTSCGKCTPKQRQLVREVVRAFQEKLPDVWNDLVNKQDPNHEFKESFDRFLHASD